MATINVTRQQFNLIRKLLRENKLNDAEQPKQEWSVTPTTNSLQVLLQRKLTQPINGILFDIKDGREFPEITARVEEYELCARINLRSREFRLYTRNVDTNELYEDILTKYNAALSSSKIVEAFITWLTNTLNEIMT
jgi:hypothetical protein